MKILGKSGKKRTAARWAGYLAAAWLLASWGVNGVVNPMHYVKNALMQIIPLQIWEDEENFILKLPEQDRAQNRFLSFYLESADYSFDLPLQGSAREEDTGTETVQIKTAQEAAGQAEMQQEAAVQETAVRVWKGLNCINLDQLQGDAAWTVLYVPKQVQGTGEIWIKEAGLSQHRRMETGRTLYMTLSFFLLAAFWEGVWWIKERYAEADGNH